MRADWRDILLCNKEEDELATMNAVDESTWLCPVADLGDAHAYPAGLEAEVEICET